MDTAILDEMGRAKALTARLSSQPQAFAAAASATAAPVLDEMTDRLRQIQPIMARVQIGILERDGDAWSYEADSRYFGSFEEIVADLGLEVGQ